LEKRKIKLTISRQIAPEGVKQINSTQQIDRKSKKFRVDF